MRRTEHPPGTVHTISVGSRALANNRLSDPTTRRVDVYVPAGQEGKGLPLLVDLVGFTAGGQRTPTGAISARTSPSGSTG
jgi:tetrahydromethanopterin S-methyltransferase subunit D